MFFLEWERGTRDFLDRMSFSFNMNEIRRLELDGKGSKNMGYSTIDNRLRKDGDRDQNGKYSTNGTRKRSYVPLGRGVISNLTIEEGCEGYEEEVHGLM